MFIFRTYHRATEQDDEERLDNARSSNDPGKTNEEKYPEDILETWQVHSYEGPHFDRLKCLIPCKVIF